MAPDGPAARPGQALLLAPGTDLPAVISALRAAGAGFAFAHGSRVRDEAAPPRPGPRAGSDLDVAAWFGHHIAAYDVSLPTDVDLLVLDTAPLELTGRVAQWGLLLLDDAPAERVRWQALTRRVYLDEQPRVARARQDFVRARLREGARSAGAVRGR